jgi:hypothetical protein
MWTPTAVATEGTVRPRYRRATAPPDDRRMKLRTCVPFVLIFSLVAGCGGDDNTASPPSSTRSTTTTTAAPAAPLADRLATATSAFLETLDASQRAAVVQPFDRAAMSKGWAFYPPVAIARPGVMLSALASAQRHAAIAAIGEALSPTGRLVLQQVRRSQQGLVDALADKSAPRGPGIEPLEHLAAERHVPLYGTEEYAVVVYGDVNPTTPWAIQLSGHHYNRTVVVDGDHVTTTPDFTGIDPPSRYDHAATVDELNDRVHALFAVASSLSTAQQHTARLPDKVEEVQYGTGGEVPPPATGLLASELNDAQRRSLLDAIRSWVEDDDPEVADAAMARYQRELPETRVAFATSTNPDELDSYIRVQGPSLWLEITTRPNDVGEGLHHHHVLYRDTTTDVGGLR